MSGPGKKAEGFYFCDAAETEAARRFFNDLIAEGETGFKRAAIAVSLELAPRGVALTLSLVPTAESPVAGCACLFLDGWHPLAPSVPTLAEVDDDLECSAVASLTELLEAMDDTEVAREKTIERWQAIAQEALDGIEAARAKLLQFSQPWQWSPIPAGAITEVISDFYRVRRLGNA